jgi:hypothetical protein
MPFLSVVGVIGIRTIAAIGVWLKATPRAYGSG